jgi:hypothetical protein
VIAVVTVVEGEGKLSWFLRGANILICDATTAGNELPTDALELADLPVVESKTEKGFWGGGGRGGRKTEGRV